jgi:transketolase
MAKSHKLLACTEVSTRKAYGSALSRLFPQFPDMVVLDAEVGNSTYAEIFKKAHPERFFEMFIAEQNMVGTAMGLARRGKLPFVSTFAAFFTRAFDQIRMSQYAGVDIKLAGSHAGVAIGEDGASQMALEDIAMFRALMASTVLYPSDAVSSEKLVEEAAKHPGLVYLRTTRNDLPVIYGNGEQFPVGGSKVLHSSDKDEVAVVAAGVTLHEALAAQKELLQEDIAVSVIDLYSVKPVDEATLKDAARTVKAMLVVEDHFAEGGIADAVRSALSDAPSAPVYSLAVRKIPKSASGRELLDYEEISKSAIMGKIKEIVGVQGIA